jgi:chromate transporter
MPRPASVESADPGSPPPSGAAVGVPLAVLARAFGRIGVTGFGGPPAHIALLRRLVVEREGWLDAREFEDANAACGLLPGPASTQLAIFCAYRAAGTPGALVGGLAFVVPAVVLILALSLVFLGHAPPRWIAGAGAGAGAAVAAVAVAAARALAGPSRQRAQEDRARGRRWIAYLLAGAAAAALLGPYLVLVLLGCGLVELAEHRRMALLGLLSWAPPGTLATLGARRGALGALAWTAFKVGALSFGGGFVIVPLMQNDAVHTYHWMSNARFLSAVALGQVTPGPVVATIAAVGYAAHGLLGGVLAALVAFTPSFSFILLGGGRFEHLRANANARAFLDGSAPAAIGAILGAAVTLALALSHAWQFGLLAAAAAALLGLRRGVVETLVGAAVVGVVVALAGGPA